MQDNITTLLELTNKGFKIKEKKKRKKRHISDIGKKQKKNPILCIPTCDARVLSLCKLNFFPVMAQTKTCGGLEGNETY